MARTLERAGAEILVMACNTAGAFAPAVAAAVGVPLLDWVDEAVAAIAERDPAIRRVGLLATSGTVGIGLYQRAFATRQIDVIVPRRPEQESVMAAIYGPHGVKAGAGDLSTAVTAVESAGCGLAEDGADGLLLACTELSVLFADHRPRWPVATYDAAQLVAERLIIMAGGRLK
jgi:aspartate racemase